MTTVLVDGHHMLHRVAFIPELQKLSTRKGVPTGPCFGFLRVLRATLNRFKATDCIVVWDSGRSAYRQKLYPEYKANRDEGDKPAALDNIDDQKDILQEVLPYLNTKQLIIGGYEGDDLLALLIETLEDEDDRIVVVTGDKDLLQLVRPGVDVYRPIADQLVTDFDFTTQVGVPVSLFTLRKALVGDKSDNIDGIRGVGEKTANKLLEEVYADEDGWWQDIELAEDLSEFKEHCAEHKGKTAKRIAEDWPVVTRNLKLMDIINYFPFTTKDRKKAKAVVEMDIRGMATDIELIKMLGKWEFHDFTSKFMQWIRPFKRLSCVSTI